MTSPLRRHRMIKIVATLGPSSSSYEMIRALFEAGADVFRLNMSHGTHADIAARHAIIRQIEVDLGRPIAILADLQGPKLRVRMRALLTLLLPPTARTHTQPSCTHAHTDAQCWVAVHAMGQAHL